MLPIAVLHVTSAEGGGADRYIRDLAATTAARHWIWHAGANVIEDVAAARYYRAHDDASLARWVIDAGIGLVHLHGVTHDSATVLARVLAARDVAYIVTLHDVAFVAPGAFDGKLAVDVGEIARVAPLLANAARVIVPSRFIASLVQRYFGGIAVDVIAPGIGPRANQLIADAVSAPADFAARAHPRRVAVVGAIGPHKGSTELPAIARALAAQQTTLVVIGYTDTRIEPGWIAPGELYVHGPYEDGTLPAWLDAYRVSIVLFPNRLPESFSYTLSEAWASRRPVIVPDAGALGERVAYCGGGWCLPAGFGADDVADLLAHLRTDDGAREWTRVESAIDIDDPACVPPLATMTQAFDQLYARFALPMEAADGATALAPLIAANLDGRVFRRELVRLSDELSQSPAWRDKLERDIAELKDAIEHLGEDNRKLADIRDAFELMPAAVRKYLLKQVFRGRR
ncbi:MAG TPA: glycosyltransferase [Casimicrobiaceae bacterium]|jgi:glycosyltransferase involved in cell wall biosynthesis